MNDIEITRMHLKVHVTNDIEITRMHLKVHVTKYRALAVSSEFAIFNQNNHKLVDVLLCSRAIVCH